MISAIRALQDRILQEVLQRSARPATQEPIPVVMVRYIVHHVRQTIFLFLGQRPAILAVQVRLTPPIANYPYVNCDYGTYSDRSGSNTCSKCPSGTGSQEGAVQCIPCPRGQYSSGGGMIGCSHCPAGSYAPGVGSTTCSRCPAQTSSQEGAFRCNTCRAGSCAVGYGDQTICKPCPKGFYSAAKYAESRREGFLPVRKSIPRAEKNASFTGSVRNY